MKKLCAILTIIFAIAPSAKCQVQNYSHLISQNGDGTYFYMRSSLEMVYIDGGSFPKKEYVENSWQNYMDPAKNFPNQYNKHYAGVPNLVYEGAKIDNAQMTVLISDYIKENRLANDLVKKWFDYNKNGSVNYDFDNPLNSDAKISMGTLYERGFYNVNAGDENVMLGALKRDREAQIKDLSMKLIPFTFMTLTKLDFYENEPVARAVRDAAIITANKIYNESVKNGANQSVANLVYLAAVGIANTAYNATKDGYTLRSATWLYRLVWDERTEAYFNEYVIANPSLLETSDAFRMEYIDCQENSSTVIFSAARTQKQIIDMTVVRNLNKVFNELQDRNDVFKVWTPLLDFYSLVSPNIIAPITLEKGVITAEIGTKEGLRGGERFSIVDDDGNFYGFAEARTGMVWDNAVIPGKDDACCYVPQTDKKGNPVTATAFKGIKAKNARTGMFLCNPQAPKKMRVAARIGTKEGVEENDKYFVYLFDVKTNSLNKVGVVRPEKGKIWDNVYYNANDYNNQTINDGNGNHVPLKARGKDGLRVTETVFKGAKNIQPGMFIRKAK